MTLAAITLHDVLLAHGQMTVRSGHASGTSPKQRVMLGTVLANMAALGYAPNVQALEALSALSSDELAAYWREAEGAFKRATGADREMGKFVVYKNFPKEVLAMDEATYWFNQILMYIGAPNEWFTEDEASRAPLDERLSLKVLSLAGESSASDIVRVLVGSTTRWTEPQAAHIEWLTRWMRPGMLDLAHFGFKENGLSLMAKVLELGCTLVIAEATDVLRLAAAVSGADVSLRETVKFRTFKRAERRFLVALLEHTKNLEADIALRASLFKNLLRQLHPGDFNAPRLQAAYDRLYKRELKTFNAGVEAKLFCGDASVLVELARRPGEFARRLHALWSVFGMAAIDAFVPVMGELGNGQLLKLRGYLRTINGRAKLIHAPRGNWAKAQFVANEKTPFSAEALSALLVRADAVLRARMLERFPNGANVHVDATQVKLATNDQELAAYGRGTVFPIPPQMSFVRSASYWACARAGNTWFDNGWLFYDENWNPAGTCCWNHTHEMGGAAVFSGDPTNSKDMRGRACQMIDLYLDKLAARGVRYAVWNILAYSHIKFADAEDVLATLQWGEDAAKGKLYEPARAQMVFPLKGDSLAKYVAYVDVVERKLVYMDANLGGEVSSAGSNVHRVAERMPAFVEYLKSLPSVADVFDTVLSESEQALPVLYSDAGVTIAKDAEAYVFAPTNAENVFKAIDVKSLA